MVKDCLQDHVHNLHKLMEVIMVAKANRTGIKVETKDNNNLEGLKKLKSHSISALKDWVQEWVYLQIQL